MPSDAGHVVGLVTFDVPKVGSLVWIAGPTYDEPPSSDEVSKISDWRWPVLFPLQAAIRHHVATVIGTVAVPEAIRPFPVLRSGNRKAGWVSFTEVDGQRQRFGTTADRSLPIYQVVNDTRLKEMVVTGWRPEDTW